MATGFSAVKSGIVMFVVPFVFAFYPELLLIDEAVLNPQSSSGTEFLPGYDGEFHTAAFTLLIGRLALAFYLLSSALSAFDKYALASWEIVARLILAVLLMASVEIVWIGAVIATVALMLLHYQSRDKASA